MSDFSHEQRMMEHEGHVEHVEVHQSGLMDICGKGVRQNFSGKRMIMAMNWSAPVNRHTSDRMQLRASVRSLLLLLLFLSIADAVRHKRPKKKKPLFSLLPNLPFLRAKRPRKVVKTRQVSPPPAPPSPPSKTPLLFRFLKMANKKRPSKATKVAQCLKINQKVVYEFLHFRPIFALF